MVSVYIVTYIVHVTYLSSHGMTNRATVRTTCVPGGKDDKRTIVLMAVWDIICICTCPPHTLNSTSLTVPVFWITNYQVVILM